MKVLTTITLRGSHKLLRVGSIRSPAALPRIAVRGRAFLSEQADNNRARYYKGGQSEAPPADPAAAPCMAMLVMDAQADGVLFTGLAGAARERW